MVRFLSLTPHLAQGHLDSHQHIEALLRQVERRHQGAQHHFRARAPGQGQGCSFRRARATELEDEKGHRPFWYYGTLCSATSVPCIGNVFRIHLHQLFVGKLVVKAMTSTSMSSCYALLHTAPGPNLHVPLPHAPPFHSEFAQPVCFLSFPKNLGTKSFVRELLLQRGGGSGQKKKYHWRLGTFGRLGLTLCKRFRQERFTPFTRRSSFA